MSLRKRIENHPVIWFLGTLVAGFSAGLGAYHAILEIAHLKVVPASAVVAEASSPGSSDKTASPRQAAQPRETSRENVDSSDPSTVPTHSMEDPVVDTSTQDPPPPVSARGQVVRDIRFELDTCDGTDECVLCDVRATALNGDQEIKLYNGITNSRTTISRAINLEGHEFPTDRIGFGANLTRAVYARNELIEGIPLSLRLEICDFEKGNELALVEVSVEDDRGQFRVPFRAVPVRRR